MIWRIFICLSILVSLISPASGAANAANWADEIIYFVMVDRFADGNSSNNQDVDRSNPLAFQGGDLVGLKENLGEIAGLGATIIWITPVAKQIEQPINFEGEDFYPHHGYWAKDLNRIDLRYGSEIELKELVEAAHELGLKVILDVVYNHLGYGMENDSTFARWLRSEDSCGGDDLTLCLAGLPDFRTELPEVQRYLFEANVGLAERVGLDGFRLDTLKHVSHAFWQAHRKAVDRRLGEDFMLIGELWDADRFLAKPYFANDEVDALFDFSFRDRTLKLLSGVYDADKFGRYLVKRHEVKEGYFLAPFLSNHDMAMMLSVLGGDKQELAMAATILMSIEGPPVIVYGEEIGRRGGIWPDNREVMAWGEKNIRPGAGLERDETLREMFVELIALRKEFASLRGGEIEVVYSDRDVLIYRRGADALVTLNRSEEPIVVEVGGLPGGSWEMAFSSVGSTTGVILNLPARSARIFVLR